MARKSTSRSGAQARGGAVMDRTDVPLSIPPTPSEARTGSSVSLEMVNVFGEPVAEQVGDAQGALLRLTAWVNNVGYLKDVWVDAYLLDPSGAVVHSETLVLDYREGAGGGGDFFVLDAPIAPTVAKGMAMTPITRLQYRLYYQIGDTVYAEGILHEQALTTPGPAAAKPGSSARAAAKKTGGSAPGAGSGEAGAAARRIARRRSSA